MSFIKTKRIKNPKLLTQIRSKRCVACSKPPPNEAAHIQTKGSGGGDTEDNVFTLCRRCHMTQHRVGFLEFAKLYPAVKTWLNENKPGFLENRALKLDVF